MYKAIRNLINTKIKLNNLYIISQGPRTCSNYLRRFSDSRSRSKSVYLIDEDPIFQNSPTKKNNKLNKFTVRTCTCGELTLDNVKENVILCGWLEYQRMEKFVVIRDSYGETQLLINDTDTTSKKLLENLPLESIIEAKGTVLARPTNMKNKNQKTGDIEVLVDSLKVLNKAQAQLPFNIREFQKAKESLRMQYRYLDLRFPFMQRNLRLRSEVIMKIREFLVNNCGFVDVETPTLFKATPGGAQEFIVPTRFPGEFYSLVQSPQQFKQMLMAGSIDRYFQIARCYRDEGARPDRQPEFTQLDIEMSFTTLDGVLGLIEELLYYSWPNGYGSITKEFPRMVYHDAMEVYGSDQPDISFDFTLKNCTNLLPDSISKNYKNFGAYCLIFPKNYSHLPKTVKEKFERLAKQYSTAKLVQSKVKIDKNWIDKLGKLLTTSLVNKFIDEYNLKDDCILFISYGDKQTAQTLLGKIRVEYANELESIKVNIRKPGNYLLWIVDFPLFEYNEETRTLESAHHPFTAPHPDDIKYLESEPSKVRALSYDLVLNGNEIGGGSIRIHDPELQEKILNILNIDKGKMQHILDMLASGCPPHGGIALGLDRFFAKILNTTSIRDVIAFPKTFEGRDLVSGAPSEISEVEEKLYHITSVYPVKAVKKN